MRSVFAILLVVVLPFMFTSCHKTKRKYITIEGEQGPAGEDGTNGSDGLNALGFDYVRGMDGAEVCDAALIIPAHLVVPANVLALAPAEDPYDPDGLTLTFGTADSPFRVYLGFMLAGEHCLIEKVEGEGWVTVGDPLVFSESGFVAVVPLEMIPLLDPTVVTAGRLVEFPDECRILDYSKFRLAVGDTLRINFDRGSL